jgi:CBS domain-containing protein
MTTVRDLFHPGLLTCPPDALPDEIAALLVRHRVHALFVADGDSLPEGVVTDADLLAATGASAGATARDLMSSPVASIDVDAPLAEAARRLRDERLGRLLVSEDGRAAGVLSVSDLVAALGHVPARVRGTVAEVMSHGIVVCQRMTPLTAAARAMTERRSRSIVVLDAAGRPAGVVTGHDLLRLHEDDGGPATVADLAGEPLTIGPDASLEDAAATMALHRVHRLLVVDPSPAGAAPVGLISTSDIVAALAGV